MTRSEHLYRCDLDVLYYKKNMRFWNFFAVLTLVKGCRRKTSTSVSNPEETTKAETTTIIEGSTSDDVSDDEDF